MSGTTYPGPLSRCITNLHEPREMKQNPKRGRRENLLAHRGMMPSTKDWERNEAYLSSAARRKRQGLFESGTY
jgi:hypothetical protein